MAAARQEHWKIAVSSAADAAVAGAAMAREAVTVELITCVVPKLSAERVCTLSQSAKDVGLLYKGTNVILHGLMGSAQYNGASQRPTHPIVR